MGKFDSTLTRVKPVFEKLTEIDNTGIKWLPKIFSLANYGCEQQRLANGTSSINKIIFGEKEAKLSPPVSLLSWLIRNLGKTGANCAIHIPERKKLLKGDCQTIEKALELIQSGKYPDKNAWYILEGLSQPDVYIETDKEIIVIEGKRTENWITIGTKWMPKRHQMLRHIDAAWEISGQKKVYGLLIVEGNKKNPLTVPKKWIKASRSTTSEKAISQSLPHRGPEEQSEIKRTFQGVLTWQSICEEFDIPWSSIPPKL